MEAKLSANIDKVLKQHKAALAAADADKLQEQLQLKLRRQSASLSERICNYIPSIVTVQKWFWRLLLLYLLLHGAHAFLFKQYPQLQEMQDKYYRSDLYTNIELAWQFALRKLSVFLHLSAFELVQKTATRDSCLLPNPLHKPDTSCCGCKFNISSTKISSVEKMQDNFETILSRGVPRLFLVVNHHQKPVKFSDIQSAVVNNRPDISLGYNKVETLSGQSVSSLKQLFSDPQQPPQQSAVRWNIGHVEGIRHLRPLVERPNFIRREIEVNLGRSFVFLGSQLPTDKWVNLGSLSDTDGQVFAVSLWGEASIIVRSDPSCCKKKNKVARKVTLRPGRLLSLQSGCYSVEAARMGKEQATIYFGSVAMQASEN